ncbi:MAG: hypothetical protein SGPRY_014210, partial [Prymnesium sp.]
GRVILDVGELLDFSFDALKAEVTWGSGHTNGQLYVKLSDQGLTFPLGMEGDVGSAGLVLGCGRGPVTHYPALPFPLQAVEYVDYQGTVKWATSTSNMDMLWMARGGGGEFPGVVTKFRAIAASEPKTVHFRSCDMSSAHDIGRTVIREWAKGLRVMSKSARKVYSYIHFYPNTATIWVRYKCFACDEGELEWFDSESAKIAEGYGGICSDIRDHIGHHPKQFVNLLAAEPGVGAWQAIPTVTHPSSSLTSHLTLTRTLWQTLPFKPHYWPGDNGGIFAGSSTAGAYYGNSYEVDMGMLDDLWSVIYSITGQHAGAFAQQFYLYSMESDAFSQSDNVGGAHNGYSAKWIIHFKTQAGEWSEEEMKSQSTNISKAIGRYSTCDGFYNYMESTLPCATSGDSLLAAYISDPIRARCESRSLTSLCPSASISI